MDGRGDGRRDGERGGSKRSDNWAGVVWVVWVVEEKGGLRGLRRVIFAHLASPSVVLFHNGSPRMFFFLPRCVPSDV